MLLDLLKFVAGLLFGGGITFLVAQRKLRTDNVTAERAKWREQIRSMEVEAFAGGHGDLWVRLSARTNPTDSEDLALVRLVRKLAGGTPSEWDADELAARFAYLLKHDWDRAKRETSWWPFSGDDLPWRWKPLKRVSYTGPIYRPTR